MTDLPEASAGLGNRTAWCVKMHEIALAEGVALDDLRLSDERGAASTRGRLFYEEEVSCKEHYVKAIATIRATTTNSVKNFCYFGHDPSSRACAACLPGMNKGDDRMCHRCESESLWLLFRGDLITLFAYQVPLTLFLKSGRPQALKSAMFASFMFFTQTVTLLGKDSGYFLGSGFVQQEGKQMYIDTVDAISRFLSTTMVASATPIAENSTVTSVSVCPMSLDRHELFVKNAVIRSLLLLFCCIFYNNIIYWLFVQLRLHYYAQLLLSKLSGGRLCADNHFEWNTEVRVMWQERVYDGPPPSICQQLKGLFVKQTGHEKRFAPVYDTVAYGPSAILLDFHTCGTLFDKLKSMESAKEKVAQVQARAQFKLHDVDGDNLLEEQEMHNLLLQLGERPKPADVTAIMEKYGDRESGSISENQFAVFWIQRRRAAREKANLDAHSSCRRLFSPSRWCHHNLSEFRPTGSVRAECVVLSREFDVAMEVIQGTTASSCCREKVPVRAWFSNGEDTLTKFQQVVAEICTSGVSNRVRVNHVFPYSQREVLVNFDVLPQGYTNEDRLFDTTHSKKTQQAAKQRQYRGCCGHGPHTKAMQRLHVAEALETRDRLGAMFADTIKFGDDAETVEACELNLENLVDMKDAIPQARFFRAVMMLCATVLYYPVIQETIPMVHCTAYQTDRWWNFGGGPDRLGTWESADLFDRSIDTETRFLASDRSTVCDGHPAKWTRHFMVQTLAYTVLAFCVICPLMAYHICRTSKHAAMQMARKDNHSKDGTAAAILRKKKKKGCLRQIFLEDHYPPTHSENLLFESRILRDPFSGLYAMCEQRAYYWFVVDLMRKAAVTVIFIFGKGYFDWQFVMLCMFVFFALIQDVAQPYRGRAENLFSFMTLLFIVVLIHTSTTVKSGSLLPLTIALGISGSTLVLFIVATGFQKKADNEAFAVNERSVRKALDLWGRVGKHVLRLDPSKSDEDTLKRAFRVFDNVDSEGKGRKMRKQIAKVTTAASDVGTTRRHTLHEQETEARGNGAITRWELMAVRDNDRRLSGYRIDGLEEQGSPATDVVECFNATEDEIDEMILQCDSDGKGSVTYPAFVAVIFDSWERRNQTDMLCSWLFKEYCRADVHHSVRVHHVRCCMCCVRHATHRLSGKWLGLQTRYLERNDRNKFTLKESDLSLDTASFMGMLEAISMRERVDDGKPPGFFVDMDRQVVIGLQCKEERKHEKRKKRADDQRQRSNLELEQASVFADDDSDATDDSDESVSHEESIQPKAYE
jgi:Ca2+-binding EF-hand superfamily protein